MRLPLSEIQLTSLAGFGVRSPCPVHPPWLSAAVGGPAPYHPTVDSVVRLISPFPPAEVRERIAGGAKSKPLLGHWGFARPHEGSWGMDSWMRLRRDQGVRARFVTDDEVVLEQWIQFLGRLTIDSCRVELVP